MNYRNTTKTSIFAGGKWVKQGGSVSITKPNNAEQAHINAGRLVKDDEQTKPTSRKGKSEEVKS